MFAWVVKIGLFIIPFLPLYVSTSMLFPFITGKNFAFRIITEIIFVFWTWLAIANPDYRPKLTWLFKSVTAFTLIVFFADIFGPNPYRSLFSNFERMEGFMMIGHMYLYYLMLSTVLRRRDWTFFFHSTLIGSLAVSYIGFLQKLGYHVSIQGGFRVDSTIGNPTYLAAYLLFNLWVLLILMYTFRKKWWAFSLYGVAFAFELMILYFTATRGAIIGLGVAGVMLAAALLWKWSAVFPYESEKMHHSKWPMGRKITGAILAVIIVFPLLFWMGRNTEMVQSNQVLRRLTNYSLQEGTIQARFYIWGQSWKGFFERPILGWGQENYYLVFQKYYNPNLWGDEPWFDRSHNIFFDWLIHAGILGLGAYLAMYAAVFTAVIKGIKKQKVLFWSGAVVMAALLAHIIQNLFVFDNLNTYLLFFAFLAYGAFLTASSEENAKDHRASSKTYSRAHAITIVLAVILSLSAYSLHIAPIRQSKALIQTLIGYQQQVPMDKLIDSFKQTLAYDSFGNTEVREQIVNIDGSVVGNQRFSNTEQLQYINFGIDEMRKLVDTPAKDVKHMMFLGTLYNQALGSNPDYPLQAKNVLEEAVRLSPTKQIVSFELAQFYVMVGQNDAARDALYKVWKLAPEYKVAGVHTWVMAVVTKRFDIAEEVSAVIPPSVLSESDLVRLGESYRRVQDFKDAVSIYAELVRKVPENPKYHATYAGLLAAVGRNEEARRQVEEAIKRDPSFAKDAVNFLQNISK